MGNAVGVRAAGDPAVFDAHVHIYSDDRQTYPHVPGRERPLAPSGSAEALLKAMDAAGAGVALLVQTPWLGEDNRYLVEAMRRYPDRLDAVRQHLPALAELSSTDQAWILGRTALFLWPVAGKSRSPAGESRAEKGRE